MTKGVLVHRPDSIYDDLPETRYHFPYQYKSRLEKFIGDWVLYYEPRGGGGRLGYSAVAKIQSIVPDPSAEGMFFALIEPDSYIEFEHFVPYYSDGKFLETRLETGTPKPSGLIRSAVREIPEEDFFRIFARGFDTAAPELPRKDESSSWPTLGVRDEAAHFDFEIERQRVEQTLTRAVRDRVFRRNVLDAYDRRCALTGLRLINGGGRAEVEAAHIRPVASGGPDSIRNGLALSGTVHWMFDRGLIALSNDYEILVSRHVNDPDQVWHLVNSSRIANVPEDANKRPHPQFLSWHREHCFKH